MPEPMDAYSWLNYLEGSHLSETSRLWVEQINEAFKKKKSSTQVQRLVDHLLVVKQACSVPFERAEVLVECALALSRIGHFLEASHLLEETEDIYQPHLHYLAVVLWMKGCIQWNIEGAHDQACISWKQSLEYLAKLDRMSIDQKSKLWYQDKVHKIEAQLATLICQECSKSDNEVEPIENETLLQLFRVVEKIPAGGFGPVGYDKVTIGDVEVSQVLINNKPHRIASLRGSEHLIRLPANQYVVVEVTGDSMNNPPSKVKSTGIDKGDYVLLLEQNQAKDGDIVAAEIDNEGSYATLKRFHIVEAGARYILSPESTNPDFQTPREFTHLDEGFHIRGVALAVFKPI